MMGGGIGAASRERRRNLVIMPEGGEDAGFVHPHGHDRFPDIDPLLLGARCHGPRYTQRHNRPEPTSCVHSNPPASPFCGALFLSKSRAILAPRGGSSFE